MPESLMVIVREFWSVLSEMAPYLLFGFLVAGLLSVLISPQRVERHLGGEGLWPVFKAAALGVPLPLCSCGVIPVSASLRRHGASRGATTSFLISTPQTGVDSIMATWSLLGGFFAIYRAVFAFITGVVGGFLVSLMCRERVMPGHAGQGSLPAAPAEPCHDACCATKGEGKLRHVFTYGFITLPKDIGRPLLIGLVVAALISTLIPENYFANVVPPGILQMLVLMLVGIPVYVCATASIPLAFALILTGVSPGAAFAFLVTGPATNAATIATIWKVMGRRTTVIYLGTMAVGAMAGGLLLDMLLTPEAVHRAHEMGWMLPQWAKSICAVALLLVLGYSLIGGKRHAPAKEYAGEGPGFAVELKIKGMTCSHCVASVRSALLAHGVASADVDLPAGVARVTGEKLDVPALCQAIRDLGYEAQERQSEKETLA